MITAEQYNVILNHAKKKNPYMYMDIAHDAIVNNNSFELILKGLDPLARKYKTVNPIDLSKKINTSVCTKCKIEKHVSMFYVYWYGNIKRPSSWCKLCMCNCSSSYYKKNRKEVLKKQKRNKHLVRVYQKKYRDRNREDINERGRMYYYKNREKILAKNKEKKKGHISKKRIIKSNTYYSKL